MTKNDDSAAEIGHSIEPGGDDAVIGLALRWSLAVIAVGLFLAAVVGIVWLTWPQQQDVSARGGTGNARPRPPASVEPPKVRFTDITRSAGIEFVHVNGAYGEKFLPETMGGGVAFFDYDNDNDPDLLFVNSCNWEEPDDGQSPTMALYQNDGTGKFTDVTKQCGLDVTFYGMGVAVGDYDNDGWRDLFLTAVGANRLLRNVRGTFVDVTSEAKVAGGDRVWSTSCGWLDYNNDGLLDLFVCNYVKWNQELNRRLRFTLIGDQPAYGPPTDFEGEFSYLYRNDGNGKFSDVSAQAGLHVVNDSAAPIAKALGAVFYDFDHDGYCDIVVANDTTQNQLFHNQQDGTFREIGRDSGIGFNSRGKSTGAMGIDAARFRNSDAIGVAIGNFANEPTSLYVVHESQPGVAPFFDDEATSNGLGPQSLLELSFGLFFFDFDLDGRLDLLAANGHLEQEINQRFESQHYQQLPHLFWNAGTSERTEFMRLTSEHLTGDYLQPMIGRGASFADIDADGDLDVVLTAVADRPRLLRNDQQLGHHWLRLRLVAAGGNRDAIGARVEVWSGDRVLHRRVSPTRSYLSQSELPLTFGLGKVSKVAKIVVYWPDGSVETFPTLPVDRQHTLSQTTAR